MFYAAAEYIWGSLAKNGGRYLNLTHSQKKDDWGSLNYLLSCDTRPEKLGINWDSNSSTIVYKKKTKRWMIVNTYRRNSSVDRRLATENTSPPTLSVSVSLSRARARTCVSQHPILWLLVWTTSCPHWNTASRDQTETRNADITRRNG